MKRVLITGAAGFIGSQLMGRLKERDGLVVKGIDNFNKHLYSPSLKVARMNISTSTSGVVIYATK